MPHNSARTLLLVLFAASTLTLDARAQQTGPTPAQTQASTQTATPATPATTRRRRRTTTQPRTTVQPQQTPAQKARQRANDQRLVRQQEANRERMQQENDHQVSKVISDQMKQQAEPRIQDAPSYTPPAPLPGTSAPNPDQRIQDAPGPTPAPQPTQTTTPPQLL